MTTTPPAHSVLARPSARRAPWWRELAVRIAPAVGTSAPHGMPRASWWRAFVVLAVAIVAGVVGTPPARADGLRPSDAPRAAAKPSDAPALPSEYLEVDQEGIRFSYHPSTRERIRPLFDRAKTIRAELSKITGTSVLRNVEVRVAAVPAEMVQLAPGEVPASALSVAFFEQRIVVMSVLSPSASSPLDLESTLTHALAHVALDEATGGAGVPSWFHEGFALHAAGAGLPATRALVEAAVFGRFLTLDELALTSAQGDLAASSFGALATAQAADFVRFLAAETDKTGAPALPRALRRVQEGERFDQSVLLATAAPDRAALEARWSQHRARRYAFVPVLLTLLGTLLAAAAIVTAIRRSRRARTAAIAAVRARRERPPTKLTPARPSAKLTAAARLAAGRGKDAAIHLPRDPEVPKVEHNGEWHTLH